MAGSIFSLLNTSCIKSGTIRYFNGVIGASVADILTMLSKDILKLIALAALIAIPVAWLAMRNWLRNFAYRVTINRWVFVLAGGVALLIALATISYQAIKAALANPVKSLRAD